MDVSRPHSAVVPSLEGDVLVALAGTTRPLTGRQVAQLVRRGSQTAVSRALDRLVAQGVVHRQEAGRAYLHTLNRNHLAVPAIEALATMRTELLGRLRGELASWEPRPVHASLFGSAARADGDAESDVDILLVRPDDVDEQDVAWRDAVDRLARSLEEWTGNHAGLIELTETEFARLPSAAPPILAELRRDGIDLAGTPLRCALAEGGP